MTAIPATHVAQVEAISAATFKAGLLFDTAQCVAVARLLFDETGRMRSFLEIFGYKVDAKDEAA